MLPSEITSAQHKLIKSLVKLRESKSFRQEKGLVLTTGKKIVRELSSHFPIHLLLYCKQKPSLQAKESVKITESLMKKITHLQAPESIAAVFSLPKESKNLKDTLLILDEIQDPGNLGTLFRSALALNRKGIILTPNSVDPFNDKAIRASKGAVFHMPYQILEKKEVLKLQHLYLADLDGIDLDKIKCNPKGSLILSHESKGTDFTFRKGCHKIKITMNPLSESLNVATSGSIILYHMRTR